MAKIKKWVAPEEGEEGSDGVETRKPKTKEKVPDSAFVAWLREKTTSRAVHVDMAKDYLLEGAPYRGDSTYDAKDAIKELGGTWCPNPDKRKDCEDKSIRRGWWSAPNETTLKKLLHLPNDDRGRRQWTPLEMGATQISFILSWLDEFTSIGTGASIGNVEAPESANNDPLPARKRTSNGTDGCGDVPEWIITAKYVSNWVPDTECVVCGGRITDQFMDCACSMAVWERCVMCGEKYRIDFRMRKDVVYNANAWCKCSKSKKRSKSNN